MVTARRRCRTIHLRQDLRARLHHGGAGDHEDDQQDKEDVRRVMLISATMGDRARLLG
jgi:hypothetical protein